MEWAQQTEEWEGFPVGSGLVRTAGGLSVPGGVYCAATRAQRKIFGGCSWTQLSPVATDCCHPYHRSKGVPLREGRGLA